MYNSMVSASILLSFLQTKCGHEIDDFCKQKSLQLSVEIDALQRSLGSLTRQGSTASMANIQTSTSNLELEVEDAADSTAQSKLNDTQQSLMDPTASRPTSGASARPPSGESARPPSAKLTSRPTTPGTNRSIASSSSTSLLRDDIAQPEDGMVQSTRMEKEEKEKQLQTLNTAAKLAKELLAGSARMDFVDDNGDRMSVDSLGHEKASSVLQPRAEYTVAIIRDNSDGTSTATSLLFKLHR